MPAVSTTTQTNAPAQSAAPAAVPAQTPAAVQPQVVKPKAKAKVKPKPRPPLPYDYNAMTEDQKLLTQMLYDESRRNTADMPYIASAVYNRAGGTGNIGKVIKHPRAFQGLGANGSFPSMSHREDNDAERDAWAEALRQAMAVYKEGYEPVTTATHFHAPTVSPSWNAGRTPLAIKGVSHSFYDDVPFDRPWSATPMPALSDKPDKYKVVAGDNFEKIGRKLGGIPSKWLMAWNRGVTPESLRIGDTISYMPIPEDYVSMNATGKQIANEFNARKQKRLAAEKARQASMVSTK